MGRIRDGTDTRDPPQQLLVALRQHAAPGDELAELAELDKSDRGLYVRHAEVEAKLQVVLDDWLAAGVACGRGQVHAVLAEPTQPNRDIGVRGHEHTALASGEQ